jgi:SlyX protein
VIATATAAAEQVLRIVIAFIFPALHNVGVPDANLSNRHHLVNDFNQSHPCFHPRLGCNTGPMSNDQINPLEEQVAHLTRVVDDLSDIIARQEGELALLTNRVRMLMEREASREADAGGSVALGNQRPPHW